MQKVFIIIACFCTITANAQNYLITFSGTGASATVTSVKVENLTLGTSLTLGGTDILRLTGTVGISSIKNIQLMELKIYPNPITENSIIEVNPPSAGDAVIAVFDMTGRVVFQIRRYLEKSQYEFILSGLNEGIYLINVGGRGYQISGKLFGIGQSKETINIREISNNYSISDEKQSDMEMKGDQAIVDMNYTTGDRLKFTGTSGTYSTVITDIPSSDKTITFNFTACTDGDNNNYAVIGIGNQIWMAENLKTTKYRDGITAIPLVPDNTNWSNLISPGYSWYNNDEASNKNTYGALYNWYSVNTGNLCPSGWHVSTDVEWTTLENYLIANGYNYDGTISLNKIAKALASSILWTPTTTIGAVGNSDYPVKRNATGFTTLPGGYRDEDGSFNDIGADGGWWSATESAPAEAFDRYLYYNNSYVIRGSYSKKNGFSVRCLKD